MKREYFYLILMLLLAAILIVFLRPLRSKAAWNGKQEWEDYTDWCCEKFDVPKEVMKSLIFYESSWNPEAVSASGKHGGLCQVAFSSKISYKGEPAVTVDTDLLQPYDAIYAGTICLAYYIDTSDSLTEALNRYNGIDSDKPTSYSKKILKRAANKNERE